MRRLAWMSLAGLMWASTAFATSTPAERKQAQKIAAEATRAFKAGDFEHAAKLVRDAYALDPAPTLLYNLARALEAADDEEGAVEAYERYLREDPDSENRGAVEQRIETLKAKLREEAVAQQPATPAPTPKPTPPPPRDTGAASSPGVMPFVLMGAGRWIGRRERVGLDGEQRQEPRRGSRHFRRGHPRRAGSGQVPRHLQHGGFRRGGRVARQRRYLVDALPQRKAGRRGPALTHPGVHRQQLLRLCYPGCAAHYRCFSGRYSFPVVG